MESIEETGFSGLKGLIDIEKHNLDQSFGTLCLEENRTEENIKICQDTIDKTKNLLSLLFADLAHIKSI